MRQLGELDLNKTLHLSSPDHLLNELMSVCSPDQAMSGHLLCANAHNVQRRSV